MTDVERLVCEFCRHAYDTDIAEKCQSPDTRRWCCSSCEERARKSTAEELKEAAIQNIGRQVSGAGSASFWVGAPLLWDTAYKAGQNNALNQPPADKGEK